MDPISGAIGVAGALVTLSGLALSIGKTLTNIASIHGGPALLLYSLAGACKAIEIAWNNIQSWLENQRTLESVGESLLDQLMSAIEVGKIVLGALKQDLKPYELTLIDPPRVNGRVLPKFRAMQRLKAVLNEGILKDHCVRLNLQVSSLHLLLATTKLCATCPDEVLSADTALGRLLEHNRTSVTACAQCFARMKILRGP